MFIDENNPLYEDLLVREYLDFIADLRGMSGKERKQNTDRTVEEAGLKEVYHRPIHELSKGYHQRVGLAAAIIHRPSILILDEPTDGLDPNQKDIVRQLIREVSKNKAIILSSHILEEAEEICDRVIVIAEGRIVTDRLVSELLDSRGRLSTAFKQLTSPQTFAGGDNL